MWAQADFYGLKKIPDENDIPPEYPNIIFIRIMHFMEWKFWDISLKNISSDLAPGVWMK